MAEHLTEYYHFNSGMVRLKAFSEKSESDIIVEFQFRYGSIKRYSENNLRGFLYDISIPVWFD